MLDTPRAWTMLGAVVLAGCTSAALVAPTATVNFVLDAPLCSMSLPVQFSIDSLQVGTDTFRINIRGGNYTTSRSFTTSPGRHTLSARSDTYMWPEKSVTLVAGKSYADSLSFYCS